MGRERRLPPAPLSLPRRELFRLALGAVGAAGLAACKGGDKGDSGADTGAGADPLGTCGPGSPTAEGDVSGVSDPSWESDPFTLGVASGDPLHDRVILWTRLCVDPIDVAATPQEEVELVWELAADEAMTALLQQGVVMASPELAHAVHVDVDGLDSETEYFYRFRLGDWLSPVGRTKTLPCEDARPESMRLGFATCQRYSDGYYAAHRDLAEQRVDLVVFLGDYIYESTGSGVRTPLDGPEPMDLDAYRNRYGTYRSDTDLQAAHASAPWMPIWDDHEVENNYTGEYDSAGNTGEDWAARRAAAYRAWYEHMPVRLAVPTTDELPMHRHAQLGDLVQVLLLDGRQWRDLPPCDGQFGRPCDEVWGEDRQFLGETQEAWLRERLQAGPAQWTFVASPVVMLPMDFGGLFVNPDQWDGYPLARQRLLDALDDHGVTDAVVFSGDIHASGVGWVPDDPADATTPARISEFVVPAITSGSNEDLEALGPLLGAQPHIQWWDFEGKGWVLVELGRERLVARYRIVADPTDVASAVSEARTWEVTRGAPGPVELEG